MHTVPLVVLLLASALAAPVVAAPVHPRGQPLKANISMTGFPVDCFQLSGFEYVMNMSSLELGTTINEGWITNGATDMLGGAYGHIVADDSVYVVTLSFNAYSHDANTARVAIFDSLGAGGEFYGITFAFGISNGSLLANPSPVEAIPCGAPNTISGSNSDSQTVAQPESAPVPKGDHCLAMARYPYDAMYLNASSTSIGNYSFYTGADFFNTAVEGYIIGTHSDGMEGSERDFLFITYPKISTVRVLSFDGNFKSSEFSNVITYAWEGGRANSYYDFWFDISQPMVVTSC